MALNGIHLIALLEAPDLIDEDIPKQLRNDWRGLVREWREMQKEERSDVADRIERNVRIRLGKRDPYPHLKEADAEPLEV